jgi:hypothetical protein
VTCTATDASLNTSVDTFVVTVIDVEDPTFTAPLQADFSQNNAAGLCSAVVSWSAPVIDDNCPGATVVCVPASGSTFVVGVHTVTCTATDASLNTSIDSFTVTVTDGEIPVIEDTPRDSEAFASPTVCEALVTWIEPTATDNCAPAPTPSYEVTENGTANGLLRGGIWPVGVYLVTYSATDANNNDATETSFTITVICPALFIRGDANGNGTINIGDPYWLLLYLFNGSGSGPSQLSCKDAADANDDEMINVSDAVFLYSALMGGGAAPSAPWPNCGEDPTGLPGSLSCDSYAGCP